MRKLDLNLKNTLQKTKYFLLDLDGTLYLENKPIGDMKNTLKFLREQGKKLVYLTNNSSKGAHTYVEKLKKIGFYEEGDLVYSSGVATIEYLNRFYKNKSVYLLGTESYKKEMLDGGINLETAPLAVKAGANVLVTGNVLFSAEDKTKRLEELRAIVK